MNNNNNNDKMQRPSRPNRQSRRSHHKRNPSIRTLMKSKRYQQATPKMNMEQVFFSPHGDDIQDFELEAKMAPKIERLESVINRLRIENSHAISKSNELQSKASLLQRTLKHSKQQYSILENENKKLQKHNKYLKGRLNDIDSPTNTNQRDDDTMSIVSLRSQIQSLQDTHRIGAVKQKKIKKSLEEVINDPALPSHLRTKLVMLLPNFYTTENDQTDSSYSAHMRLDILSDNDASPPLSPTGIDPMTIWEDKTQMPLSPAFPTMLNGHSSNSNALPPALTTTLSSSSSFDKKRKLINYKKRKIGANNKHNRNLSLASGTSNGHRNGYMPKITITTATTNSSKSSHQRSVSSNSYRSSHSNFSDDLYSMNDSESEHDEEEKEANLRSALSNLNSIGMIIPPLNTSTSNDNISTRKTPKTNTNGLNGVNGHSKSRHKRTPSPLPKGQSRPKPPPPPRSKKKHRPYAKHRRSKDPNSDDLTQFATNIKKQKAAQHLNLSEIKEERLRTTRSASHIGSPSSVVGVKGSPTTRPMVNLILDIDENIHHFNGYHTQPETSTNNQYLNSGIDINMNRPNSSHGKRPKTKRKIPKEKRALYQRSKANTAFEFGGNTSKHRRSKSHQRFGSFMNGNESDSDFSTDTENVFDPFEAKRNRFFQLNFGKKKNTQKKRRKQSVKLSKKEEKNLNQRRSSLRKDSFIASKRNSSFNEPLIDVPMELRMNALNGRSSSVNPPNTRDNSQKKHSSSTQITKNKKKKRNSKLFEPLTMSKTESADSISNSLTPEIMTVNPLSPDSRAIQNGNHNLSPMNLSNGNPKISVSKPTSPMLNPMKPSNDDKSRKSVVKDDIGIIGRNLISGGLLGTDNPLRKDNDNSKSKPKKQKKEKKSSSIKITKKNKKDKKKHNTKSSSLQLNRNISKDYYRNKLADGNRKDTDKNRVRTKRSREDIEATMAREPQKQLPINAKTSSRTTRMDQIRMQKLAKPRHSSPSIIIPKNIHDTTKPFIKGKSEEAYDSPIASQVKHSRRSSFSIKRRKKTDHFELGNGHKNGNESEKTRRSRRSNHSRSMSLRGGRFDSRTFSVSPQPPKSRRGSRRDSLIRTLRRDSIRKESKDRGDHSPERRKKYSMHFSQKRHRAFSNGVMSDNMSSSDDEIDKVWTVKDLIREMVSNGYDTDHVRNALILCHISFVSSVELFEELRRFFRMSITQMTSTIVWFDHDEDDENMSSDDRRWFMRQRVTECILYWITEYWEEDFANNRELQKKVELFKGDIRSVITEINRSKTLIEPLMETLTYIANKYGGINPKNLNLIPRKPKKSTVSQRGDDEKKEQKDADEDEEKSVVIHDDSDEEDTGTVVDGSFRRKKKTINLLVSQRDRTASINYAPSILPEVSKTAEAQNIIKSHEVEQEKKEMEKLTKSLRKVTARFPDLIKLEVVIPHNFNIMELDPEDVAVQLTLLDSFVFKKIKKRECIEQNWKRKDKALKAPNILKMIGQFNDVSKWVQLTILKGTTPRLRKRYIKKMISMATYFMQNGNLSSLCAFYNALTSTNISSLSATWKLLSKSKRKELEEIKTLFGWKMQKFKQMQEELQPPCVPHIGPILQVLFQIDEGKESKDSNGSVNYIKMMMLHDTIDDLETLQSEFFREEPNFLIQKLLIHEFQLNDKLNDNHLYRLSKTISDGEKNKK